MPWFRQEKSVGLFAVKDILSRQELRAALRQDRGVIPGTLGQRFNRSQRIRLEREVFGWKKFGPEITKQDWSRALTHLRGRILSNPESKIKETLTHKLRYLKKLAGP